MTKPRVAVLDYGSGNVHSVCAALERAGAEPRLTAEPDFCATAEGLVIPGVGAFAAVMKKLHAVGAPKIIDRRLVAGLPTLGICVGMQVLFERGFEHGEETPGLSQWPGDVLKLKATRLPHIGWTRVMAGAGTQLFEPASSDYFYFVHSYAAQDLTMPQSSTFAAPVLSTAEYEGQPFLAAVENGPLVATQFHPEKSGEAGLRLLKRWVARLESGDIGR